jgi:AGZA family xanthine/uracil permease-like MFS transporter
MPLTYSVAEGIALGFISYVAIKLLAGRFKDLNPAVIILALLFVGKFVYL